VHPIATGLEALFGLPSWKVERGYGSFVTIEFGEPHVEISEVGLMPVEIEGVPERALGRRSAVHGDWHLWIYQCEWSLTLKDIQLAHSESNAVTMNRALHVLNGQCLAGLQIDSRDGSSVFSFDLGCVLTVIPDDASEGDEPDELWLLFEPSGQVLAVRNDGSYCRGPSTEPTDQHRWSPIAVPVTVTFEAR
jgi:hypothetical protein